MDISIIFEGWVNFITQPSHIKKMAEERAEICLTCPHRGEYSKLSICKKCGCPLAAKTISPKSHCPIGLWSKAEN